MLYKLTLFWIVLLNTFIYAKDLHIKYEISFGIFGKVGTALAHLHTDKNSYSIEIEGKATGLAKNMSGGREEIHKSRGSLKNGLFISNSYQVTKLYKGKKSQKTYNINHKTKKVTKKYIKSQNGKTFYTNQRVLAFYSTNDLLTLYFNIASLIPNRAKQAIYTFQAIGAEKQNGVVKIIVPASSQKANYWNISAIIYQKIFASNQGELQLYIDKDGITQKAILKDVLLFGDITVQRI